MKILHIGKYYPPYSGGIENFMRDLLPLLTAEDNQVHALTHNHAPTLTATEEHCHQVKVIRVPSYGRILYSPVSPAFPFYLHREIKTFQPDIIHIHMPNTSAFWLLALASAQKTPWILHWHSDVVNSNFKRALSLAYKLYCPFEQLLLKKSHKIIVTSPNYLKTSLALDKWRHKAHIIPLGLTQLNPKPAEKQVEQAEKYWGDAKHRLLSIGRLTYYKGHQYLIQAVKNLPQTKLIIIGEGEEHTSLRHLVNELKLNEQVILTGKLDSELLHAMLSSCDVFCLPSIERTEAFGLVLLEAMSHCKPIVVSNIPGSGMTWVCQHQKTGLFFEPGNSNDIKAKIQQLLDNKDLQQQLGQNGNTRLKEEFGMSLVAKKTLELYRLVTTKTPGEALTDSGSSLEPGDHKKGA